MGGDERFLPFFGLKLVKGKGFSPSAPNDAVLVNEAFVKKMAIQEPVNYRLVCNGEHLIVGVVEDFVSDNLSRQIQPLLIEYNSTSYMPANESPCRTLLRKCSRRSWNCCPV